MSERKVFDDVAREALITLLENYWVVRDRDPETYQMIRDRENALKDYVLDKLGYHLIVHRYFAKLEKIPAIPEAWMGIESFQHPRDYAILCTTLAYLENVNVYQALPRTGGSLALYRRRLPDCHFRSGPYSGTS